jgi:hypothetical protein
LRRRAGACGVQMRALREAQRRVHHGICQHAFSIGA